MVGYTATFESSTTTIVLVQIQASLYIPFLFEAHISYNKNYRSV